MSVYYAVIQGSFKNQVIVYKNSLKEARKVYQDKIKIGYRQDIRIEKIKTIATGRWKLPDKNLHTIILSINPENFPIGYSYIELIE